MELMLPRGGTLARGRVTERKRDHEGKIGVTATENDFDKDNLTPTFEYYDDDNQDIAPDAPPEKLTPTPEIGDNYLNMELMLPRGGTLARDE